MKKKVVITQSNYIPWKGYFDAINFVDEFILLDDVQYTKRDWRNRNIIKTPNGPLWLTIPVETKGNFHQLIKDIKVSDSNWGKKHWKTITQNYSKAKFFNEYKDIFEEAYNKIEEVKYLSEINHFFLSLISKILEIKTSFKWSMDLNVKIENNDDSGKTNRLIELCKKINATDYYSGPTAKNYIQDDLFKSENINLHYFNYSEYKEYNQLYGNFINKVSIIDLIFNEGVNSYKYLKHAALDVK